MTAQHTPGPWTWWTSNSWRRLRHDDRGKTTDILMPWVAIDGQPDIIVSGPDMRLISAAPELLEALRLLHDNIAEYARINNLGGFDNQDMKLARAAIAKAIGNPA